MSEKTQPKEPRTEQPLAPTARMILALSATAVVVAFYVFCILTLTLTAATCLLLLLLILITRGLFGWIAGGVIAVVLKLTYLIVKSLFLGRDIGFEIPIQRSDAPRLHQMVEEMSRRIGTRLPDKILLTMDCSASIQLKGYRRGTGRTTLQLGLDLMAAVDERELECIIAHELAHAKLVQRGHSTWLYKGLARMQRLAVETDQMTVILQEQKTAVRILRVFIRFLSFFGRNASRLCAAYSRQNEFEADAESARICGAQAARSGLIRAREAARRADLLSWRDRLVQLQKDGSYTSWLQTRLTPQTDEEIAQMEERALSSTTRGEFDTHPSLAHRLAAFPEENWQAPRSAPAISLLEDPDDICERLVTEIEQISGQQERKDSRQQIKQTKQRAGGGKSTPMQQLGLVIAVLGGGAVIPIIACLTDETARNDPNLWVLSLVLLMMLPAGIWIIRRFGPKEDMPLPVPSYAALADAMDSDLRKSDPETWREDIEAELKAKSPPIGKKKSLAAYWAQVCYDALAVCDFQRAWVASGLCLRVAPKSMQGLLGYGISSAYFGLTNESVEHLNKVFAAWRLSGSMPWGLGWATVMLSDWEYSEGYLHIASDRMADQATLRALLAVCQWQRGKIMEAIESAKQAGQLAPSDARVSMLLIRVLLTAGRIKQAMSELEKLEAMDADKRDVILLGIHARLLLERREEVESLKERLLSLYPETSTLLRLAQICGDAHYEDEAQPIYEEVCSRGFCPEALLGLATIAWNREDKEEFRRLLLSSLDLTREVCKDTAEPFDVLPTVLNGLTAINDPVGCTARAAKIDLKDSPAPADTLGLLVCSTSHEEAEKLVTELYQAMHPEQSPKEGQIKWESLGPEQQPDAPVAPGFYGIQAE